MRKLFALPALLLALACTFHATPRLSAQSPSGLINVQTVITKTVDKDRTQLITAPLITTSSGRPSRVSVGEIELTLTATSDATKAITIYSRLTEKAPDGKVRYLEDVPAVTIAAGQKASVRAGAFQLEFTPSLAELPDRTVNVPGGTIAQLIAWLPKSGITRFDLVADKADLEVDVPAFSLRYPTGDSLATALNKSLNPRGLTILASNSGLNAAGSPTVYLLQKFSDPDANKPANVARFRSYQLTDYLVDKQTVDEITQAIHVAWTLFPDHKAEDLKLKFHPSTTLLLVTGPEEGIRVVENVLVNLRTKSRYGNPTEEAARMETVAAEVRRRRAARQVGTATFDTADEITLDTAVAAEARRRVEERRKSAESENRQTAAPAIPKDTADTSVPALPETFAPSSPAAPPKPALDPALEKKRLETVNAEVERRRAARETARAEKSAPPATAPAAPTNTPPPTEPEKK